MSQDKLREAAEAAATATAAKTIKPYKERERFPTCTTCGVSGPNMKEIKGRWSAQPINPTTSRRKKMHPIDNLGRPLAGLLVLLALAWFVGWSLRQLWLWWRYGR